MEYLGNHFTVLDDFWYDDNTPAVKQKTIKEDKTTNTIQHNTTQSSDQWCRLRFCSCCSLLLRKPRPAVLTSGSVFLSVVGLLLVNLWILSSGINTTKWTVSVCRCRSLRLSNGSKRLKIGISMSATISYGSRSKLHSTTIKNRTLSFFMSC